MTDPGTSFGGTTVLDKDVATISEAEWQKRRKLRRKGSKSYRGTPLYRRLRRAFFLAASVCVLVPSIQSHQAHATKHVTICPPFKLNKKLKALEQEIQALDKVGTNTPGIFAIDLDSGEYVSVNANRSFSAASMIKIPILVSFLRACELNKVSMDDVLEVNDKVRTTGSGFLQWRKNGTKLSAKRTAELMMIFSDNTATNMIIEVCGGQEKLNNNFHLWGLKRTKINNFLVDLEGTNTTSPYDLVYLLGRIENGEFITEESRQFMYKVMAKCKNRSLLPRSIEPGAKIVHKTGTLGKLIGDAGIITTKDGSRYAISVHMERKRNDRRANVALREMSKKIYSQFK